MKKVTVFVLAITAAFGIAQAQEYKLPKTSGRLELYLGKVTVEGHDGNQIIFSAEGGSSKQDERAEGLRALNSLGLDDNTGLGIHVAEKGDVVQVHQLKKMHSPEVKVLVPKGVIVAFKYDSQYGGTALFRNMSNEIEVSAVYNSVELENVTGPLAVETTYGHVIADLSTALRDPISIVSIYGYVDLTLPQAAKATLKMDTSYGDIFVAPEFDIQVASKEGLNVYSNKITGTLNGGGISIDLKSNYGKIYVRRK